ncbi:hypothetical protein ACFSHT_10220 [Paraburkholderia silviterrae]|uniref:Uncharacterized protein n=1 Tax=Paraburkholderia silviterrae TaxID=2528715 RepID=A0A4R5MEK3_9BURK|nr:hypothetical protein [Paraburkholderia silviterrae]TDG25334.1 hypothetical protein EYW47_05710 [Paraburkholderia silviterrae]
MDALRAGLQENSPAILPNIDELVSPIAVRAEHIYAEIIDADFLRLIRKLPVATNAEPIHHDLVSKRMTAMNDRISLEEGKRAALPSDAAQAPVMLTDEQRGAIEWAAGRAHVASLGKPIDGMEGQRWRVLNDLFRAAPVATAAAAQPAPSCDPADVCAGCRCEYGATYGAPDSAAQPDEQAKADRDLTLYGESFMVDGKHVSLERITRLFRDTARQPGAMLIAGEARMSDAARDVFAERARQVNEEGWDTAHDDRHVTFSLSQAAACYAFHACGVYAGSCPVLWPWDYEHRKPTTPRRDLVKAGALILAEIEHIDRTEGKAQ